MSHSKVSSGARLWLARALWGWVPHPTQRQWLMCDADVKVAACGRRWGKTEAAAVDASTMALLEPGSVQMIVSPTYDQSRLIFDTVERLLLASPITRAMIKVVRTPYPRLACLGSVITARTADEDGRNLRGNSADRVIVDEAAFVKDSVIREVISPMLADRGGRLVMISTPFGKNHFYRAFVSGQAGAAEPGADTRAQSAPGRPRSIRSFNFPSWENPHISRDYIEAQRQFMTPRQFAVEYEAAFVDDQNAVFAWEDIEAAACLGDLAAARRGCPAGSDCRTGCDAVAAGIDWARYSDYTAVVAVAASGRGCEVVGMDRFNGVSWGLQVERVAGFLRKHQVTAVLADQTSIGDPLLEQLRTRLWQSGWDAPVEGCTFTNQVKRELIEHLAMMFAQRTIAIPRDECLMRELQYFEYELTSSGGVRLQAAGGCHDDLVIALALACSQVRTAAWTGCLASDGRISARGW